MLLEYRNGEFNISKKDFVILFVGRLAAEKNIEFLLESQKELIKKHNNIKLVMAQNIGRCTRDGYPYRLLSKFKKIL